MKKRLAALALAVLLPVAASAADLDYRYVDVAFSRAYTDSGVYAFQSVLVGGQGYLLDGSFGIGEHWFVEGAYQKNRFHSQFYSGSSIETVIDSKSLRLGGGFHTAISDHADFVAHLDLGRANTDEELPGLTAGNLPHSVDHGYVAGVALRVRPTDSLELDLGLDHDTLGFGTQLVSQCTSFGCYVQPQEHQDGSENVVSTALRYRFGMMGVGLEYRSSNFQAWRETLVSLRFNF